MRVKSPGDRLRIFLGTKPGISHRDIRLAILLRQQLLKLLPNVATLAPSNRVTPKSMDQLKAGGERFLSTSRLPSKEYGTAETVASLPPLPASPAQPESPAPSLVAEDLEEYFKPLAQRGWTVKPGKATARNNIPPLLQKTYMVSDPTAGYALLAHFITLSKEHKVRVLVLVYFPP